MLNEDHSNPCGILYVDDEDKALKYFRLAFASQYRIFTAESAAAGLEVLAAEAPRIGIILSDQRMPEMIGSEFLGIVRDRYPRLVRILTTAYSDLDSAIQAVNKGHIYQYVVKPWQVAELGMVLHRAADYFQVLTERDALLRVKMTTLQRIICSDRVKSLLLAARLLPAPRGESLRRALGALVQALPLDVDFSGQPQTVTAARFDISGLLRAEYHHAALALDQLSAVDGVPAATLGEALRDSLPGATLTTPAPGQLHLHLETTDDAQASAVTRQLFGVLAGNEIPRPAAALLQTLVALARDQGQLRVTLGGPTPRDYAFDPATAPELPESLIDTLYEKFSAADISRL